ncbi:hypothetical protein [Oceanobacillus sp. AG]|uniref:hypothetical protein n=1 Tax=Oceanobacillus sp. AG TaxID=2681969 RepID=UPI0018DD869D|nr:hypothetical protein [Oceanobacillus sp. AG]
MSWKGKEEHGEKKGIVLSVQIVNESLGKPTFFASKMNSLLEHGMMRIDVNCTNRLKEVMIQCFICMSRLGYLD